MSYPALNDRYTEIEVCPPLNRIKLIFNDGGSLILNRFNVISDFIGGRSGKITRGDDTLGYFNLDGSIVMLPQ